VLILYFAVKFLCVRLVLGYYKCVCDTVLLCGCVVGFLFVGF